MKFWLESDIKNRARIHIDKTSLTVRQADSLAYHLEQNPSITRVKVYERTADVAIFYTGERKYIITFLKGLSLSLALEDAPEEVLEASGRKLSLKYKEQLTMKVLSRIVLGVVFPYPARVAVTVLRSFKYIAMGLKSLLKGRLEVPVLDAIAIFVSMVRGDFDTAGSVMFLLGIGEILEGWTHKKSVDDLAKSMALKVSNVWLVTGEGEVLVKASDIREGDEVIVRMGNVVPFDGKVTDGEAFLNQSSLTGESLPVRKKKDGFVYAGTVVEEGQIKVLVEKTKGRTKYEQIVRMIEESEKLKSSIESKSSHIADSLVP